MKRCLPLASAATAWILALYALCVSRPAFAISLQSLLGNSEPDKVNIIHVSDLDRLMKDSGSKLYLYDANPVDLRASSGIIPGARLLASSDYDVAEELPADKSARLVFYCHNVH